MGHGKTYIPKREVVDVEKERLRAALSCAIGGLKDKGCHNHLGQISTILAGTRDAEILKNCHQQEN